MDQFTEVMWNSGGNRWVRELRGQTGTNTVAIDHGEYFFGSGLFYAAFKGNASADFFRSAGYSGFALCYRDLIAFIGLEDPSGMDGLAKYLDQLLPLKPVVTNLIAVGTPLNGRVRSHALIELSDSRKLALLGIVGLRDRTHGVALLLTPSRHASSLAQTWNASGPTTRAGCP